MLNLCYSPFIQTPTDKKVYCYLALKCEDWLSIVITNVIWSKFMIGICVTKNSNELVPNVIMADKKVEKIRKTKSLGFSFRRKKKAPEQVTFMHKICLRSNFSWTYIDIVIW